MKGSVLKRGTVLGDGLNDESSASTRVLNSLEEPKVRSDSKLRNISVITMLFMIIFVAYHAGDGTVITNSIGVGNASLKPPSPSTSNLRHPTPPKISTAITITSCPSDGSTSHDSAVTGISDGASVLKHSVTRNMKGTDYGGNLEFVAFVHVGAKGSKCEDALRWAGWKVKHVETPIKVEEIRTKMLKERISINGCCGEIELIKFHAYTLTDSDAVLLMDIDSILLKPITPLLQTLLTTPTLEAMYTKDWGMVAPGKKAGAQGGFLLLKPSLTTFDL
eukprot:CAMPEP_0118634170 /NCGR_PEP_ID=MMETSP0785-20121206/1394_1 /TAXON_ID=91992 /ORGANISM="Bolidomonas pacifica, Strain CCMP 1866" /LENGTH=276 /DNA_ID=CAMNT_0006525107 /DNA_START=57 /DNA_END=884 /DNA_ORIENTATION=-